MRLGNVHLSDHEIQQAALDNCFSEKTNSHLRNCESCAASIWQYRELAAQLDGLNPDYSLPVDRILNAIELPRPFVWKIRAYALCRAVAVILFLMILLTPFELSVSLDFGLYFYYLASTVVVWAFTSWAFLALLSQSTLSMFGLAATVLALARISDLMAIRHLHYRQ